MFGFVILNYNSFELTVECIDYIKRLKTKRKINIVVVDNNTLKESEVKLLKKISDKVIVNQKNLGFAKGNNKGIEYLKKNANCDFICCLNSDCLIKQEDFIEQIYKMDKKDHFDMLGPKILSDNYLSWNPFPVYKTLEEVENKLKYYQKLDKIYRQPFLYFLLNIYLLKNCFKKEYDHNGNKKEYEVALHGCCLIFSKKYIDQYKDAFLPDTFLFHEEEFLYQRMKKDGLVSVYDPSIVVYHLEGKATEKSIRNKRKRLYFKNKYKIDSLTKLKKYMVSK